MTRHYTLEQLNPQLLVLDERFQSRQTNLIGSKADKAASDNSRKRQIDNILTSLGNGNGVKEPIEAYELFGELFVVSGFHRTEACHRFLKNNPNESLLVPVKVFRGYTEAEAYSDSLTKNLEHGTALDKSEVWQNKFKQSLMLGENLQTLSKRGTAKLFDCGETQGLHILNAQKACIAVGLPKVSEWQSDYQKAATRLKRSLMRAYEQLGLEDFDKDGFPIISRLAKAAKGTKYEGDLSDDELEQRETLNQLSKLEELIAKNPITFRKALDMLDKKALGLVVKRQWDENSVILKYCEDSSNPNDDF
ncbi:hypothetical protein OOY67_004116 [Vibrio parahaemolyticus]|nr:hypothetical protein [Vibrio parahaemolyticus]HCH3619884.1 hypothetical protein [Vibrio parahaemolyticus]